MIRKINHKKEFIARKIFDLFQSSYKIEAEILEVDNFPPLQRTIQQFVKSITEFYAFYKDKEIVALIEVSGDDRCIDIESLVVDPAYFRNGIGAQLMRYIFSLKKTEMFVVETGLQNRPAVLLYEKLGFQEVKQWDTSFGVRKIRLKKPSKI
ncbi:GNAT family N-acetyltransferase [Aquimarina sp. 2201CG1-2-11]|uniref:GNAT family N-acetyltransferase n=1 Tax=Aquimarina discodermiae TaxID=3231043 RepID=UPI0034631430